MSVAFANAVVEGLRYNDVHVKFEPGWERRGNGQASAYAGSLTHHTGGAYDGGYRLLVDGRSDLRGPLCNMCTWADGSVTLIAAHPANHAGAAGGVWARPFPDTRSFNRMTWGNEVMYPGTKPWTPAQYRTARVMAAVVCGILRKNAEWARGHYETSVTGKWDPGVGNGRHEWFPMNRFRAEIWDALHSRPITAPSTPGDDDDMGMQQILVPPAAVAQTVRLIVPTGKASRVTGRSWVSMAVNGPDAGTATVWAQDDDSGVAEREFRMPFANGRSGRDHWALPDGTTQINCHVDMPQGGVICLEWQGK